MVPRRRRLEDKPGERENGGKHCKPGGVRGSGRDHQRGNVWGGICGKYLKIFFDFAKISVDKYR